jgi:hypothetical protein
MITSSNARLQYNGNGSTDEFAYGFPVTDKTHILVTLTDSDEVETTLTVDTDYTVAGVDSEDSGDWLITLVTPPASGERLTVTPNIPELQETDFDNQGGFFPELHENALDKLTLITQQLQEQVDRAVKLPVGTDEDSDDVLAGIEQSVSDAATSASASASSASNSASSATASANSATASAASATASAASAVDSSDFADTSSDFADAAAASVAAIASATGTSISAFDIDWSNPNYCFYKTLSANATFTFSNVIEGKTISVAITNTASNFTADWPAGIKWPSGAAPTLTVGAKTDVYTFVRINSITYGASVQNMF